MNRREALQAGLGVLSALSIDGEVATISPRNPQAFVLSIPHRVSASTREAIKVQWKHIFSGTELENVPVLVLDNGAKLEVIDNQDDAA